MPLILSGVDVATDIILMFVIVVRSAPHNYCCVFFHRFTFFAMVGILLLPSPFSVCIVDAFDGFKALMKSFKQGESQDRSQFDRFIYYIKNEFSSLIS